MQLYRQVTRARPHDRRAAALGRLFKFFPIATICDRSACRWLFSFLSSFSSFDWENGWNIFSSTNCLTGTLISPFGLDRCVTRVGSWLEWICHHLLSLADVGTRATITVHGLHSWEYQQLFIEGLLFLTLIVRTVKVTRCQSSSSSSSIINASHD